MYIHVLQIIRLIILFNINFSGFSNVFFFFFEKKLYIKYLFLLEKNISISSNIMN